MIIKKVSTTQFAGLTNNELELNDGLNLIVGNNESGKSTFVNMISRTFFQETELKKNELKDFGERYFPHKTGMPESGNANGTVIVRATQTNDAAPAGDYKLYKKWSSKKPDVALTTPKGTFDDPVTINEIMNKILGYGEGVYTEMLLSSQDAAADNLQKLLGAPVPKKKNERYTLGSDTKEAISNPLANQNVADGNEDSTDAVGDVIANAAKEVFSVGGGMVYEEFEKTIDERIKTLIGNESLWDFTNNCPKALHGEKPRQKVKDSVTGAAYDLRDAKENYDEYDKKDSALEAAELTHNAAQSRYNDAVSEINRFKQFAKQLEVTNSVNKLNDDMANYKTAKGVWKKNTKNLNTANRLSEELKNRKLLDSFKAIDKLRIESETKTAKLGAMTNPDSAKIQEAADAEDKIKTLARQKLGLKVALNLTMHGDYTATVKTTDGRELDINAPITEAAIIEIPGVMTLEMAPEGIDPHALDAEIATLRSRVNAILNEYGVNDVKELTALRTAYTEAEREAKNVADAFNNALGGQDYNALSEKVKCLTELREKNVIENEIRELGCDNGDVDEYIADLRSEIRAYELNYKTPENLEELIANTESELEELKNSTVSGEEIPEEYIGIANPQAHLDELEKRKSDLEAQREKSLLDLHNAMTALNAFIKDHPGDLAEKIAECQRVYDERLEELRNWQHILEVFKRLKEEEDSSPFETLTNKFRENLSKITDSRVVTELKEKDKLDFTLTSADNSLNYDLLSNGTKEAVFLAFRLAMLDHLFSDGGGVMVFDDPLSDMDDERVMRSCELIKEYSTRHQIIFLTCSDKYTSQLGIRPENVKRIMNFTPTN